MVEYGGMSKKEVEKHLKYLETDKGKIGYLNKILDRDRKQTRKGKRGLLAFNTFKSICKVLGQLYEKNREWRRASIEYSAAGDKKSANRTEYLEHAQIAEEKGNYERAGIIRKLVRAEKEGDKGKAERLRKRIREGGLGAKVSIIIGLGIILGVGLYYLFSNVSITGSVVTNVATSSFLVNFILLGILGLVCYSYLK